MNIEKQKEVIVNIFNTMNFSNSLYEIADNLNNTFLCVLSLILFIIAIFIQDKFKLELPTVLEAIIYLFIFAAEILEEINNFYGIILHWDTILHTLNEFLVTDIGFLLIDLLNQNKDKYKFATNFIHTKKYLGNR